MRKKAGACLICLADFLETLYFFIFMNASSFPMFFLSYLSKFLSDGILFPNILIIHSSLVTLIAPVSFSSFLAKVVLPAPINPQIT